MAVTQDRRLLARSAAGFALLSVGLAATQAIALRKALPSPDTIAYFEIADQIAKVGYIKAQSSHWSPLYSLYVAAARWSFPYAIDRELEASVIGFGLLLLLACGAAYILLMSLVRLVRRSGEPSARQPWVFYGLGLTSYLCFGLQRADLRLPDALVFVFAVLLLWAWIRSLAAGLSTGWSLLAGIFAGAGFVARSNVLHWSLVVAVLACTLAPGAPARRRTAAAASFLIGLLLLAGLQVYAVSRYKGTPTIGETGKLVFAETYGATWPLGHSAWPVRMADGNVRIFTESRTVGFPGFYDPGREYHDATVPFRLPAAMRGIVRACQSCLFGYYSTRWALMWPALWAVWPIVLTLGDRWRPAVSPQGTPGENRRFVPDRVAWLLVGAGLAGVGMHLLSFCIGYYLAPYLFLSLMGLALMNVRATDTPHSGRAFRLAGAGFMLVSILSTASLFRSATQQTLSADYDRTSALASAIKAAVPEGQRRIAVAGPWLGLYAVRLSGSQVHADIPDRNVLSDPERLQRAMDVLRTQEVTLLLVPSADYDHLPGRSCIVVVGGTWCLLRV